MIFDACSLAPAARSERGRRLQALRERAVDVNESDDRLRLLFLRDPTIAAEIAELAALEAHCCGVRTQLEIGPDSIEVELTH